MSTDFLHPAEAFYVLHIILTMSQNLSILMYNEMTRCTGNVLHSVCFLLRYVQGMTKAIVQWLHQNSNMR